MDQDKVVVVHRFGSGLNNIKDDIRAGKINVLLKFLVIHAGTNSLFTPRKQIIQQVIDIVAEVRERDRFVRVFFSSLLPRPNDHKSMELKVQAYNDAMKTAVGVADRKFMRVRFINNYRYFVDKDGLCQQKLFHKSQNVLSKKGVKVLMLNLFSAVDL